MIILGHMLCLHQLQFTKALERSQTFQNKLIWFGQIINNINRYKNSDNQHYLNLDYIIKSNLLIFKMDEVHQVFMTFALWFGIEGEKIQKSNTQKHKNLSKLIQFVQCKLGEASRSMQ